MKREYFLLHWDKKNKNSVPNPWFENGEPLTLWPKRIAVEQENIYNKRYPNCKFKALATSTPANKRLALTKKK